jgi:hypothetical protein
VSLFFESDGRVLWNPAHGVGQTYVGFATTLERTVGLPSGLDDSIPDDTIRVGLDRFLPFVKALAELVSSDHAHPILAEHARPVLAVSLVMLERADKSTAGGLEIDRRTADQARIAAAAMPT